MLAKLSNFLQHIYTNLNRWFLVFNKQPFAFLYNCAVEDDVLLYFKNCRKGT